MNDETAKLIAKVRKERRGVLVVFPLLILLLGAVAGYAAWFSLNHFEHLDARVIPADTGPELLRAILVNDLYRILAPMSLVAFCLSCIFCLSLALVPKSEHKLLLLIAEQIERDKGAGNQQSPGAYSSSRPAKSLEKRPGRTA